MIQEHIVEQNSPEWLALRCGRITASEAGDFLGTPAAFKKLLYKKAAEILTGGQESVKSSAKMERGHEIEPKAKIWYSMEHGKSVRDGNFWTIDDFFGLSPDGIVGNLESGLECKAINQTDHFQMIETGEGCKSHNDHLKQCKFSMYFMKIPWQLYYYHDKFPNKYCGNLIDVVLDTDTIELIEKRAAEAIEFLTKYKNKEF